MSPWTPLHSYPLPHGLLLSGAHRSPSCLLRCPPRSPMVRSPPIITTYPSVSRSLSLRQHSSALLLLEWTLLAFCTHVRSISICGIWPRESRAAYLSLSGVLFNFFFFFFVGGGSGYNLSILRRRLCWEITSFWDICLWWLFRIQPLIHDNINLCLKHVRLRFNRKPIS